MAATHGATTTCSNQSLHPVNLLSAGSTTGAVRLGAVQVDLVAATHGTTYINCPNFSFQPFPFSPAGSTTGAVRLGAMQVDAAAGTVGGRLEFCFAGTWGTVCQVRYAE